MSSQSTQGYVQSVDHFANQQRQPEEALYLLLDPFAGCPPEHPLAIAALSEALGSDAVTRIDCSRLVQDPECWPALVRLAEPGDAPTALALLSATCAARESAATWHHVCGWLISDQPADLIAQHISQQCQVLHQPEPHGITAWFEPVRLALLRATLKNAGEVLGPVRSWLHPDGSGSCEVFEREPMAGELAVPEAVRATQHVAPQIIQLLGAWHRLSAVQHPHAPWHFAGSSGLPENAPTHAMNLILKAFRQGLRDRADIQCMCLHMLMIHPLLLQHPTIQHEVERAAAGEQRLADRFASYDDCTWSHIVAGLPKARSYP
ncbi:hypothetical protein NJH24_05520 [Pseudomonas asiatica]|uniref:hypothetical protein n=1 Tax=Pseudomonas asiatica TaxID=2219225 RepID=UPI00209AD175|nr:hypothetical protein [Pseudomonas asiatica]MCO7534241.1 hypothetical protein [Pseudomonas asiatica]MCO7548876.1 hypothetical protein [Pseudomonas asiatica]MCO7558537.1 hypothetical protein [Pseudomonas asiatica]